MRANGMTDADLRRMRMMSSLTEAEFEEFVASDERSKAADRAEMAKLRAILKRRI